jgi:hypothetical protein
LPAASTLQLLGVVGVLSYAAARFAAKAGVIGYSRYTLVAVPARGIPKAPRGFSVRALTQDELSQYAIDVNAEEQARRFAQGLTCLAAFNGKDEFVGVTWVGTRPFDESLVHLRFVIPDNAIWDTGLWIHPDHRLGRGFVALWAATGEWMRAQGRDWSMSWIADYNLPSLLSHRRMQSINVGHISTFRFFNWQYMSQGQPKLVRINESAPADLILPVPA